MTNEERLSKLIKKVADLKTDLAIKKDQKERVLKDLEEYNISSSGGAEKLLDSITEEIDDKETLRDKELEKAEAYLEQYDV